MKFQEYIKQINAWMVNRGVYGEGRTSNATL